MATNIEDELIALEKQYWQAIQDHDLETLVSLTDFPCFVTGPQGVGTIDKATYEKMMQDPGYSLEAYTFNDLKAKVINADVGIVAYKIDEDVTVDGEPMHLEVVDASTWVKKAGRWTCAQHAEAIVGDPFGRDRQKPRRGSEERRHNGSAEESSTVAP